MIEKETNEMLISGNARLKIPKFVYSNFIHWLFMKMMNKKLAMTVLSFLMPRAFKKM